MMLAVILADVAAICEAIAVVMVVLATRRMQGEIDMLRSRAAEPPHSSADASTPRQAWMTDEQARRYGDGA